MNGKQPAGADKANGAAELQQQPSWLSACWGRVWGALCLNNLSLTRSAADDALGAQSHHPGNSVLCMHPGPGAGCSSCLFVCPSGRLSVCLSVCLWPWTCCSSSV